jgi:hypothetical protein
VRESRTPGSVRGVLSNGHPYRVNRPIAALGPPAAFDPLADISRCYQIGRKLPLKIRSLRRVIPSKDAPEGGLGHPGHDPFLHDALIRPLRVSARATRASDVDDKVIR